MADLRRPLPDSDYLAAPVEELEQDIHTATVMLPREVGIWASFVGAGKYSPAYKRLILSYHKNLNKGDFLIDDSTKNGASEFEGEHIHFKTERFPNWRAVMDYLMPFGAFLVR